MSAESQGVWPDGRRAALSLSYDGTTINHLETVLPLLFSLGIEATFYAYSPNLLDNIPLWREAYRHGYEIGNGALLEAAHPDGSLLKWTSEMIASEIEMTDLLLDDLFVPIRERSFGYPWGLPRAAQGLDYREILEATGYVARSGNAGMNSPFSCDLRHLNCCMADEMGSEAMIHESEMAAESGSWLIFAFEGVGVGERGVDSSDHEALCRWISSNLDRFWTKSVIDVAHRVRTFKTTAAGLA